MDYKLANKNLNELFAMSLFLIKIQKEIKMRFLALPSLKVWQA